MAKLVQQPSKGFFQITEKGKRILSKGTFTLKDLKEDSDYIAHEQARKEKKENEVEEISVDSASPQDLLDSGFSTIEAQVKTDLLERLRDIDPYYFEKVILILLKKMGYGDFVETAKSGDGGID